MKISTQSGTQASALGLGAAPGQDPDCIPQAFISGINFFYFYQAGYPEFLSTLCKLLKNRRKEILLATGSEARNSKHLRSAFQELCSAVATDVIDIFFAEYINPSDDCETIFSRGGVLDELSQWKAKGAITYVGASAHDRPLASRLAGDPRVDVVMHRYNMAHRKAVDEVFPTAADNNTPIVAFTATRWGTLLHPHYQWQPPPPTAADCYRYCLAHPTVDIVLTSPKTTDELEENLFVLKSPPMSSQELSHWRKYGDLIYEAGRGAAHDFESKWP